MQHKSVHYDGVVENELPMYLIGVGGVWGSAMKTWGNEDLTSDERFRSLFALDTCSSLSSAHSQDAFER